MKIFVKNLGALEQAEFELGDMTIICGKNNTGKTYATHVTFAFLDYCYSQFELPAKQDDIDKLFLEGTVEIPINQYYENIQDHLDNASDKFSKSISRVFAGKESLFLESSFSFKLSSNEKFIPSEINIRLGSPDKSVLQIRSSDDRTIIKIYLIVEKTSDDIPPRPIIEEMIARGIGEAVLRSIIPRPFLASAERTGAAIFQRELDFTKNRLVELLGDKTAKIHPLHFLTKFIGEYPIAVRKNVDFIRALPDVANRESHIMKNHPEILDSFREIIGGEYKVSKEGEIQFVPSSGKRIKLTLVESSSAVRSLLDIGFYLRHVAKPGDLLMVDEPELNLHPDNQRKVARLFARLVKIGIKVFITTHSDYIIKELNTLILLNRSGSDIERIRKENQYHEAEIIPASSIRVYTADQQKICKKGHARKSRCQTLIPADIDPILGIEAVTFDTTIDDMNRIQEEILFSGEDGK